MHMERGTRKDLVSEKEEIECNKYNKAIQQMINFDYVSKKKT